MYWIHELCGMLIGLTIGVTVAYVVTRKRIDRIQEESRMAKIEAYRRELQDLLEEAVQRTSAASAVLLHLHNGADQIYAGKRIYSSVVEEAPTNPALSVKNDWQERLVDDEYLDMIVRLKREKVVVLNTEAMPASMLRRLYERMNVTCSVVFWCNESKGGPYYVSFPTTAAQIDFVQTNEFSILEAGVSKIRNLNRRAQKAGILH